MRSTLSEQPGDRWQLRDLAASPYHLTSVRAHFIDLLAEGELTSLTEISERVVDRLARARTCRDQAVRDAAAATRSRPPWPG